MEECEECSCEWASGGGSMQMTDGCRFCFFERTESLKKLLKVLIITFITGNNGAKKEGHPNMK